MIDATPILAADPCDAFRRASSHGYVFSYEQRERSLRVEARIGAEEVGWADFVDDMTAVREGSGETWILRATSIHCDDVSVVPKHQRRGVATTMYVVAERVTGLPLQNSWDRHDDSWTGRKQSEEAAQFWAQPGRSFGDLKR